MQKAMWVTATLGIDGQAIVQDAGAAVPVAGVLTSDDIAPLIPPGHIPAEPAPAVILDGDAAATPVVSFVANEAGVQ